MAAIWQVPTKTQKDSTVTVRIDFGKTVTDFDDIMDDITVLGSARNGVTATSIAPAGPAHVYDIELSIPQGAKGTLSLRINHENVTGLDSDITSPEFNVDRSDAGWTVPLVTETGETATVRVDFGKTITGASFTTADITVVGLASNVSIDSIAQITANRVYDITLSIDPGAEGAVSLRISEARVTGLDFDITSPEFRVNRSRPTWRIPTEIISNTTAIVRIDFGKTITVNTFTDADIDVLGSASGITVSSVTAVTGTRVYDIALSIPQGAKGTVSLRVLEDSVTGLDIDTASPEFNVDRSDAGWTVPLVTETGETATVRVDFGKTITGASFTTADITVVGLASNVSIDSIAQITANRVYDITLSIDPGAEGAVSLRISEARVTGLDFDITSPEFRVNRSRPTWRIPTEIISNITAIVRIDFGKTITGNTFTDADIDVLGSASGITVSSVTAVTGTRVYDIALSIPQGAKGTVSLRVLEDSVTGLDIDTASPEFNVDRSDAGWTVPLVTETGETATVRVDFGKTITGASFTTADITVVGLASNVSIDSIAQITANRVYDITLSIDPGAEGAVSLRISEARVTGLDFDITSPEFKVNRPQVKWTIGSETNESETRTVSIDFGKNVTRFVAADIDVLGSNSGVTVSSVDTVTDTRVYNISLRISPGAEGTISLRVNAVDVNGLSLDTTSPLLNFDRSDIGWTVPTSTQTNELFSVQIDFGKDITGNTFTNADITVLGSAANKIKKGTINSISGEQIYDIPLRVAPGAEGTISLRINHAGITGLDFDITSPEFSVDRSDTGWTVPAENVTGFTATVQIDFGEDVSGFVAADITVLPMNSGVTVSSIAADTGTRVYDITLSIDPGVERDVSLKILKEAVIGLDFDITSPEFSISTDHAAWVVPTEVQREFTTKVRVDFGKDITGNAFVSTDIDVLGSASGVSVTSVTSVTGTRVYDITLSIDPGATGSVVLFISAGAVTRTPAQPALTSPSFSLDTLHGRWSMPEETVTKFAATVQVDFGKNITGNSFTASDIDVLGSTTGVAVSGITPTTGTQVYDITLSIPLNKKGTVFLLINAENVDGLSSNITSPSFNVDTQDVVWTIPEDDIDSTTATAGTVMIDFGENITGDSFTASDITVLGSATGVAVSGITPTTGTRVYDITLSIPAGTNGEILLYIYKGAVTPTKPALISPAFNVAVP